MTTFVSVLLGVACGVALLVGVFLFAFRGKSTNRRITKSDDNHEVFEKDPSFYSSYDQHDK
ncbi:hypothetical protein AB4Z52_33690 [Rhizobium sp. 2YAF20]|uniref:hypothetical protein n=1 Tax=Rhizobium sp. 2YAF20 TaxID=3233027 RepID=UPI003F9C0F6E